jgi:hypothetical protein
VVSGVQRGGLAVTVLLHHQDVWLGADHLLEDQVRSAGLSQRTFMLITR